MFAKVRPSKVCVRVHVQMSGCVLPTVTHLFQFSHSSQGGVFTVCPCTSPERTRTTVPWFLFFKRAFCLISDHLKEKMMETSSGMKKKLFRVFKSPGERGGLTFL